MNATQLKRLRDRADSARRAARNKLKELPKPKEVVEAEKLLDKWNSDRYEYRNNKYRIIDEMFEQLVDEAVFGEEFTVLLDKLKQLSEIDPNTL